MMNSEQDNPIGIEDNADLEPDDNNLEGLYQDTDLLEDSEMLEDNEETFTGDKNTLPHPPTKPNVYIEDETVCPVCTEGGTSKTYCEYNLNKIIT